MYQNQQPQSTPFSPAGGSPLPNINNTPGVTSLAKTDPVSLSQTSSRTGGFQQGLPGVNLTPGMYPPQSQGGGPPMQQNILPPQGGQFQQNIPSQGGQFQQNPPSYPTSYGTQTVTSHGAPSTSTSPSPTDVDGQGRSYTSTIIAGVAGATVAGLAGYALGSHNNTSTNISPSSGTPYPPPMQGNSGPGPYPPGGPAPYPSSTSGPGPYPPGGPAPYPPSSRPPYPPGGAPYPPSSSAPYPPGSAPYPPGAPPSSGYGSAAGYAAAGVAGAALGAAAGYGAASYSGAPPMAAPVSAGYAVPPPTGFAMPPPVGLPPTGYVMPTAYAPPTYTYTAGYSAMQPFLVPVGIAPNLAAKMMQASAAFRMYDTNRSGSLSKKEFKRALKFLGFRMHKGQAKALFYTIDYNRSGKVNEREFCEWWITAFPY